MFAVLCCIAKHEVENARERVFICHSGSRPEGAMPINAGDQTTTKNTEIQVQQDRLDMLQINTHASIANSQVPTK